MSDEPKPPLRMTTEDGQDFTILRSETPKENADNSNVIGLLLLMKEIQSQKPLDDPNIIFIDKDGTPYY